MGLGVNTYKQQIYIAIDGLGAGNIIYTAPLIKQHLQAMFKIKFDTVYMKSKSATYSVVDD